MLWEFTKKYLKKDMAEFIEKANTPASGEMNQSRIISELYFIGKLEEIVGKMIKSNTKHAKAMNILTGALVVVGILQLFLAVWR